MRAAIDHPRWRLARTRGKFRETALKQPLSKASGSGSVAVAASKAGLREPDRGVGGCVALSPPLWSLGVHGVPRDSDAPGTWGRRRDFDFSARSDKQRPPEAGTARAAPVPVI